MWCWMQRSGEKVLRVEWGWGETEELLGFAGGWNPEGETAVVVGFCGGGQVESGERNLLVVRGTEGPERLPDDGVVLDFELVLIAED